MVQRGTFDMQLRDQLMDQFTDKQPPNTDMLYDNDFDINDFF